MVNVFRMERMGIPFNNADSLEEVERRRPQMNKQPFYHQTELKGSYDTREVVAMVSSIDNVLPYTVELINGELLFTATDDMCVEVVGLLTDMHIEMACPLECEPGDPADLM